MTYLRCHYKGSPIHYCWNPVTGSIVDRYTKVVAEKKGDKLCVDQQHTVYEHVIYDTLLQLGHVSEPRRVIFGHRKAVIDVLTDDGRVTHPTHIIALWASSNLVKQPGKHILKELPIGIRWVECDRRYRVTVSGNYCGIYLHESQARKAHDYARSLIDQKVIPTKEMCYQHVGVDPRSYVGKIAIPPSKKKKKLVQEDNP